MTEGLIVLVTVGERSEADNIARVLVEEKLAACVGIVPIESVYMWEGEWENQVEFQLVIKTVKSRYPEVEAKVRELHTYEVPEILGLPVVAGSAPYLNWVAQQTQAIA
ncbi:MAG: divalent-cation tolerance protein CutA [Gloeomargarita sp. SKYG116]|nr:divalent-cation tolerance protein CutA [Gloeomargarita sp. SKYG116]MCS7225626.1 divalent-cation tolerance protein CutA [Gloeomargarita sp. SKYB31]MDW8400871.1 divalent-cation tolerance protein CutA [Gloeomargarita sp. SKYGB_i_bin116]